MRSGEHRVAWSCVCVCVCAFVFVCATTHWNTQCNTLQHTDAPLTSPSRKHRVVLMDFAMCVAVCCIVLQCVSVCWSVLQCFVVCCSVLQCVAVCCSLLQCVGRTQGSLVLMNLFWSFYFGHSIFVIECATKGPAAHCDTPQHSTIRCNTWQHAVTHCNILHYTATRCDAL